MQVFGTLRTQSDEKNTVAAEMCRTLPNQSIDLKST
jgi:hypothetical protein